MSLPDSLLRTLEQLDPGLGWSLLVRHAEREPFPPGSFGNEVSLTAHGRQQALALGAHLRGRVRGTTSSPLPRCMETARLVSERAGHREEPSPDRLLGDPGPFIEDSEVAGRAFHAMSLEELVNSLLDPNTTPEGMRTADAGCADMLALAREVQPAAGRIHVLVSHDSILAPLLARVAGAESADDHWPDFLDGVALAWDGDDLICVVGGRQLRVSTKPWREPEPWRPTMLWWLVTSRCDLSCRHCYLRGAALPPGELNTSEALDAIRQAAAAGLQRVHLTGGEPFLRPDLGELLDAIRATGMVVTGVETNGGHLRSSVIERFHTEETTFYVSFDGLGVHDAVRGRRGATERVETAVQELCGRGFRVVIQTTLTSENAQATIGTLGLLGDWSVDGWRLFPVAPIGAGDSRGLRLSADAEGQVYISVLDAWLAAGRPFDLCLGSLITQRRVGGRRPPRPPFVCNHAADTVTLLPSGHLAPCCRYVASPALLAGLRTFSERSFTEQLRSSSLCQKKKRPLDGRLAAPGNEACGECALLDACELGCEVVAWRDHGRLEHHDSHHCQLMRALYDRVRAWDYPGNGHA